MATNPDVIVIGGGVIGLTTAYFLAKENCRVEVIERSDFGRESSWAGAGILCPIDAAAASTPIERLHAASFSLFPQLSSELKEQTKIDNGFWRCGGVVFNRNSDDPNEWLGIGAFSQPWRNEIMPDVRLSYDHGKGAQLHLPDLAQVRNPRHLKALVVACEKNGVQLTPHTPIHSFIRKGKRIIGIKTANGTKSANRYLLATGAWTDLFGQQLGFTLGVKPIRGQIVQLQTEKPYLQCVLLNGSRYIVPRRDGKVLIGSTEEDAGFEKKNTAHYVSELLRMAFHMVPVLDDAIVERMWAGLRPGSPDGLPFIGQAPGIDNLFIAAGHFRAGIQLSPGTALVMKELLLGEKLSFSLEPFNPCRKCHSI